MIKKVEAEDIPLAISYSPELQPGRHYPSMICGAGPMRVIRRYEDTGECDIIVFGTHRVKFNKYLQEVPFLIGEGEILETQREMPEKTEQALLTEIREMLINWIFANMNDSKRPIQFFQTVSNLEALCNFVSYYFLKDIETKQKVLEESSLEIRGQKIWQYLKDNAIAGSFP